MAKQCIGLDIGSSSVKAVQLKRKGSGWALQAFGMQPLVPQTIVDGTIMDQSAVTDAIRQLWSRLKLRQKDVAIAIAGHSVIIKKIAVPMMKAEELQANIRNEAEHHIPFGRDDVEIDYHVTNPMTPSGQTEILLVAAKKEVVSDYVQVVRDANLAPQVVDVAAFASQNGFEANYSLDGRETIVLINIGAAISNINIVRSGVSLFTRDVTSGGNAFTEEIQKQMGIAADEAEAYKVGGLLELGIADKLLLLRGDVLLELRVRVLELVEARALRLIDRDAHEHGGRGARRAADVELASRPFTADRRERSLAALLRK